MRSFKRLALWALLLVALLATNSVRGLTEESASSEAISIDDYEDEFDFEGLEEAEGGSNLELGGSPPPNYPQPAYNQPGLVLPPYQPIPIPTIKSGPYQPQLVEIQEIYETPLVSNYSILPPKPIYTPPIVSNYNAAPITSNYNAAPITSNYNAAPITSNYNAAPITSNYNAAPITSSYNAAPIISNSYNAIPQIVSNYSAAPVYQQPRPIIANNYNSSGYIQRPIVQANYSLAQSSVRYSSSDLLPFLSPLGYRANHWSLFYYRASPYKSCPKNIYLSGPSYRDIEAAFAYAQSQLLASRGSIQLSKSSSDWAARHQILHTSFVVQQTQRMDEEGLLIELVSQYLADRACLTKWDRQRYLPQLTKLISASNFPGTHSCSNYYRNNWRSNLKYCLQSKYRTFDGFCNNPYHPYWGKSNVCHIRFLSPDYADGISIPRTSYNQRYQLPNPRIISSYIHNEIPLESPYNLMKMQWGQFINHDITNTALSSYDGIVDCCKRPLTRGCWPIYVPPGDRFYGQYNVTCLNFIRSGVCPTCQLGPRQQFNKNTAFLDASHIYGNTIEQANQLRTFRGGLLRTSSGRDGEILLPIATAQEQCQSGSCFLAGDSRVNQHPALTVLHLLLLRNHNIHAYALQLRHPEWNDEYIFQEARRLNIAEFQMITFNEYLPIVFGPILSAYYHLIPQRSGYTYYDPKVDPTTWNEYSTASCRFGHSQIASSFGLYGKIFGYGQNAIGGQSYRLKDWFMRPSQLSDGLSQKIIFGLLSKPAEVVDPWITDDVRNYLYASMKDRSGGDLAATNIWRGRDHGIPGYIHYVEYCFNFRVRGWKDLALFIPPHSLNQLRKLYYVVENIDLFTGGLAERHFPGADIGPTFACLNGIQYYHLKFGDRYYFEHGNQPGSFNPIQLAEIRSTTLAKLLCRTAYLGQVQQYAFLPPSQYNPLLNCTQYGKFNYNIF